MLTKVVKLFPILIVTAASVGTSMKYFRGVSPNYFYTILMTGSWSHNNSDNRVKRMYGQERGRGGPPVVLIMVRI